MGGELSKGRAEDKKEQQPPITERPKPEKAIEMMDLLLMFLNKVSIWTKALGKSLVLGMDLVKNFVENHVIALRNLQNYSENWIYLVIPTLLTLMTVGLLLNAVIPSSKVPQKKRGRSAKNKAA